MLRFTNPRAAYPQEILRETSVNPAYQRDRNRVASIAS